MRSYFRFYLLIFFGFFVADFSYANTRPLQKLVADIKKSLNSSLSGSLYIDGKFAYSFQFMREKSDLNIVFLGPTITRYTYGASGGTLLQTTVEGTQQNMGNSSAVMALDWLFSALYMGRLPSSLPYHFSDIKTLEGNKDIVTVKIEGGPIRQIRAEVFQYGGRSHFLSLKAQDNSNRNYVFLFD